MTNEKLISVFKLYRDALKETGAISKQLPDSAYDVSVKELSFNLPLEHVLYMCEAAIDLVNEGRVEKAFRWLGFIQGVLWMNGTYSIDDLKNHSRPCTEEEQASITSVGPIPESVLKEVGRQTREAEAKKRDQQQSTKDGGE